MCELIDSPLTFLTMMKEKSYQVYVDLKKVVRKIKLLTNLSVDVVIFALYFYMFIYSHILCWLLWFNCPMRAVQLWAQLLKVARRA